MPAVLVFALAAVSCAGFGAGGARLPDYPALVVQDSSSGRVFGFWPLQEPKEFAIEFTHSVNNSPVREFFIIEDGMIRLTAVRFYSFGAGVQSDVEEGQVLSRDGDAMVISGFRSEFERLNLILGAVSDHRLIVNGETISLQELCGKNARISIFFN